MLPEIIIKLAWSQGQYQKINYFSIPVMNNWQLKFKKEKNTCAIALKKKKQKIISK